MFEYESEAPQVGLDDAVKMIAAGLDALARIDLEDEDDRAVLDAALALQEVDNRVAGQQVR